jgi:Holliday junction resolvase RusA-like endonuclease
MIITIPFKTPSVNHLYFNFRGFQRLTTEARKLQIEIAELVNKVLQTEDIEEFKNKHLKISVDIYEDWYCKDKSVKKKDLSNREKFLIDAIMESLGLEDKFVFEETMRKIQSKEEKAIVTIEVLDERI